MSLGTEQAPPPPVKPEPPPVPDGIKPDPQQK